MPYIEQEDRKRWDGIIADIVHEYHKEETLPGELNYLISSVVWQLFKDNPSYTYGNQLIGVLECVKQEFYRRQLADYEDRKMAQNGDI